MKSIKLISTLLLCAMLVGCGEAATSGGTSDTTAADTTAADTTTVVETTAETPDIPEGTDFGGYDFRVIARGVGKWACTDIYAESETGEVLNDAVYNRNVKVEDQLGIKISQNTVASDNDLSSRVKTSIMSATDDFDLIWMCAQNLTPLSLSDLLVDMNAIDTLDLTHSWWDQRAVENLKLNDRIYMTTGDIGTIGNNSTYVISFSKSLNTEYGLGSFYDLVRDGSWTVDKFIELARSVGQDLDGNGTYDVNDLYGFLTYGSDYLGFLFSGGSSFSKFEGDSITANHNNEQVIDVLTKLGNLKSEDVSYFFNSDDDATKIFVEGRSLFCFRTLINLHFYRDMDTDYGILPIPKASENQDEYYCGVHDYGLSLIGIPMNAADVERTGLIIDVLGYESQETLQPAFYEKTLKGKYFRDEESEDMLDLIFTSRIYDIGFYMNWGGVTSELRSMSQANNTDFASKFATLESKVQADVDATLEAYKLK